MITIRSSQERGKVNLGWLDSHHTFSFGQYFDPRHMGFASLRVINEDVIAPSGGFGTHGHQDMEIVTYVLSGSLEHQDSLGNGSIILPGDVQRMSAGTGIRHSEYNHSSSEPVHLLQIWLLPQEQGINPSYEQKNFPIDQRQGKLRLVGSPKGDDGSVVIHQDVYLYVANLATGESVNYALEKDRVGWIQVAKGQININGYTLNQGDGAAIASESQLSISSLDDNSEILLFDMQG
jgi:hypothetical protein